MKTRKILGTIGAAVVAGATLTAGAVALAPTASAATISIDGCTNGPTGSAIVYRVPVGVTVNIDTNACSLASPPDTTGADVTVNIGEGYLAITLTTAESAADAVISSADRVIYPCPAPVANGSRLWWLNTAPGGESDFWDPVWAGAVDLCNIPGDGGSLPSWFQSIGQPSSGICPATWSSSWAEWANGGTGGPVCNRELYYDGAKGTWQYR